MTDAVVLVDFRTSPFGQCSAGARNFRGPFWATVRVKLLRFKSQKSVLTLKTSKIKKSNFSARRKASILVFSRAVHPPYR